MTAEEEEQSEAYDRQLQWENVAYDAYGRLDEDVVELKRVAAKRVGAEGQASGGRLSRRERTRKGGRSNAGE